MAHLENIPKFNIVEKSTALTDCNNYIAIKTKIQIHSHKSIKYFYRNFIPAKF